MQDLDVFNSSYLIIGGPKTKKSEVSRILAKRLGYKLINLDRDKHSYFDDFTDYDFKIYQDKLEKYGRDKAINYIHRYEMKHLSYVLENISNNVVVDFGNTYTLIDDEILLDKIKLFKNIVLLNVSEDVKERMTEFDRKLCNNRVNKMICTFCINIDDKSINEIVNEIINNKEFRDIL